jgi:hypothetical protein
MTLLCYYYCEKAAGILKDRLKIMNFLKLLLFLGNLYIISQGVQLMQENIGKGD